MTALRVAVGVLFNGQGQVLVGQRTVRDRYFQQWEFPGGKLEATETPEAALARELHEELGIKVVAQQPLLELTHDYPDRTVELFVFTVNEFEGEPQGLERQAIQWIEPAELSEIDFLSGNKKIVAAVQALSK